MTQRLKMWFDGPARKATPTVAASGAAAQVGALLTAAEAQLARVTATKHASLAALPTVIIAGPEGSGKTTTIVRSGMNYELLAGDAYSGGAAAPTRSINVWHARGATFVEAGSAVMGDAAAWAVLARAFQPRSARPALNGPALAPRFAVACFGCDEFFKPGAAKAVRAAARALRGRLGELAEQLGARLPVYVLFTKADAIRYFDAFVRHLTPEEAREVLGASVEPDAGGAGTYAERVTPRLAKSMDELYRSVSARRLELLAREHAPNLRLRTYEFPREFRKLAPLAVEFLRELCEPGELSVPPLLRGFYFVGAQEGAHLADGATAAAFSSAAQVTGGARSAGSGFGATQIEAATGAPPTPLREYNAPRWDFLPRIFPEVVLADAIAARLVRRRGRGNPRQRAVLAGAAGLAAALAVAFSTSFANNRRLQAEMRAAVVGVTDLKAIDAGLPTLDALRRLDSLRVQYLKLADNERRGPPLWYRWGLYSGSSVYPTIRRLYFTTLDRAMLGPTRSAMRASLQSLPAVPGPTDAYGDTYDLLKAHLVMTTHAEKSTAEFLTPTLLQHWLADREIDSVRADLAARQFDAYADELRRGGDPYRLSPDVAAVDRARAFLGQFPRSERLYELMLVEADRLHPPIQFNQSLPGSVAYVTNAYEVPGAFTKGGWTFVDNALRAGDRSLSGDPWVTAEGTAATPIDQAKLVAEVRALYATAYADHWRRFLQGASVQRYDSLRDASDKLRALSGEQSPLLALFALAARHTDVPAIEVRSVFEPVRALAPPAADKLIGPGNAAYITALVTLQSSVDQAAAARGPAGPAAAAQAARAASEALAAARQLAGDFTLDPVGQVHTTVLRLMEAPIAHLQPLLRSAARRQ